MKAGTRAFPGAFASTQESSRFQLSPKPRDSTLGFLKCHILFSPSHFLLFPCPAAKSEGTLCLQKQVLLFKASRRSNPHFPVS